jgi:ribonuclease J
MQLRPYRLEFIRMAHSIPDCVAIVIETPAGRVLHTGDWKLDHTPVDGLKTDVGKLSEIGNRGVDLMLGDSTNAERPGMTGSERLVGETFRQLIPALPGRVLIASFASNIHRMQQAAEVAIANDRKVALVGRSLRKNMNIARNLGYVNLPEDALVSPKEAMDLPPGRVMILCTGSQGEPMSALTRIAYSDHQNVEVERGDTVIISAKPVPGNELRVHDSINRLARLGAQVARGDRADASRATPARRSCTLHRSCARRPSCRSGEYHARRARVGATRASRRPHRDRENGSVGATPRGVGIVDRSLAGVTFTTARSRRRARRRLRDRRRLSEDGVLIVARRWPSRGGEIAPPELIARGFGENEELLEELREEADRIAEQLAEDGIDEIKLLQEHMHDAIAKLVYSRTRRRPMILPVVIEI